MKSRLFLVTVYVLLASAVSSGLCFELLFGIIITHNTSYETEMVQHEPVRMLMTLSSNDNQIDCCLDFLDHQASVILSTSERVKVFSERVFHQFDFVLENPKLSKVQIVGRGDPYDIQKLAFVGTILKRE